MKSREARDRVHLRKRKKLGDRVKKRTFRPEFKKVLMLRTLGNFLIISSLLLMVKTFYLPVREEIRYFIETQVRKKYVVQDIKKKPIDPDDIIKSQEPGAIARVFNIKPVEVLKAKDPNFSIVIPKIGANARVLANVSPVDERIYLAALRKGVAHAAGTSYPGERGHIFLFAHSTDYFWNIGTYNAIFYLLYKLEKGDEVNIFHRGARYVYRVVDTKIVDPSKVEYLTRKTNKEFLTLQTCWPPGTTLKRLLVFASRVTE